MIKIYIIWLLGVVLWNFGYAEASPLEDVIAAYGDNDTEAGINLENEHGHLLEEAGLGMPADLDLGLDENASFTVS